MFLLLDEKEPKNQDQHQRSPRTKRALSRHVGHGPRTQPGGGWEEDGGGIETASNSAWKILMRVVGWF